MDHGQHKIYGLPKLSPHEYDKYPSKDQYKTSKENKNIGMGIIKRCEKIQEGALYRNGQVR